MAKHKKELFSDSFFDLFYDSDDESDCSEDQYLCFSLGEASIYREQDQVIDKVVKEYKKALGR